MKQIIAAVGLWLGLAGSALAADNAIVLTPGVGVTEASKDIGGGVQSPRVNLIDITGNPCSGAAGASAVCVLGIQGVAGGTAVPVSAGALPLPAGAATSALQTTINTTLGTPFQAGGSIGNTTFASTQSGTWNIGTVTTLPAITGTVTANAGTNLNTSALSLSATQGTAADAPCTVPTTTTACSQIALAKAETNAINNGTITLGPATAGNSVPFTVGPAVLGSYCMGANTGTMAAGLAGGAPVYSFRYGGANLAIVRKIIIEADDITTAFVAGAAKFDMIAARAFTASDTGGTAATLTGNNGKLRTSYATTAISDLRISSTATLTAGTRTLDAQPLASVEFAVPTSIDADLLPTTELFKAQIGEQPFILATNEGFVIQATVPGTGTWVFSVRTCWDEVSAF